MGLLIMSISVLKYFDFGSLAEAAYASIGTRENFIEDLIAEGFSKTQAEDFVSRWATDESWHNSGEGFSSTLFQSSEGFVLAFRGTAETDEDLIKADIYDIVADGAAIHQIIDMVNEWTRITAPGIYGIAKLEELTTETTLLKLASASGLGAQAIYLATLAFRDDVIVDLPSNTVSTVVWENSSKAGLGLGDIIADQGLTVVGHSLGGHLAAAFTRLVPSANADAFTVNGAGFGVVGLNGFASPTVLA